MNIIIIGCGYVGMAIARYWRTTSKHYLTATTTTPDRLDELAAIAHRSVLLNGSDTEMLREVIQEQDAIFLSVAPTGTQQVDAEQYEKTYLQTCKSLAAVLPQVPTVKQVIYTSSCAVYGNSHGDWVDETTDTPSNNQHGEILREAEQILLSAARSDLQICIFRLGAIYGPGREIKPRFETLAGTTRPGTGEHFTNWIHLDDILAASAFALNQKLHGIYNLVSNTPVTARDLMDQVCQKYDLSPIQWDATLPRSRSNDRRVSNLKLQQQGYQFIHPTIEI